MSRNRAFIRAANEVIQPAGQTDHADWRGAHRRSATIAAGSDASWVTGLEKVPQRHTGMRRFLAAQEFPSDRHVACLSFPQKRARHRDGLFGIVSGLSDTPFIPLTGIARDYSSRLAVESRYSAGVPFLNIGPCQRFGLLTNGIADRECFEAADYAFLKSHRTERKCPRLPRSLAAFQISSRRSWRPIAVAAR